MMMTRAEAEKRLKKIFHKEHFFDEQWNAIERLLCGERVLMIQRTGFGKSLCYQFPATQFPGISIVFSPLISLMRDQVRALKELEIPAACINSEQSKEDNNNVIEQAQRGELKILYIAPERQNNEDWLSAVQRMKISMIVVDEAHTISTWGHDFRPAFKRIVDLVKSLPASVPVLATTATATAVVQEDIETQIGKNVTTIRGSLVRENLYLQVLKLQSVDEKMLWLVVFLRTCPGSGIIYAGTRAETERYTRWLQFCDINAVSYHGGYDRDRRIEIEQGLMSNKWKCVVSTNALGMGIDKPDIRFIVHTQIPQSPIHYYQEIGRAGRDGKPARIILLYNGAKTLSGDDIVDCTLPLSFINSTRPSMEKCHKVIECLKCAPLKHTQIVQKANLKKTQVNVIMEYLQEQDIVRKDGGYYYYRQGAPSLDVSSFEKLRDRKLREFKAMVEYIDTDLPRMKYLCQFLDCTENEPYINCDNTNLERLTVECREGDLDKLKSFKMSDSPTIELADFYPPRKKLQVKILRPNHVQIFRRLPNEGGKELVVECDGKPDASLFLGDEEYREVCNLIDRAPRLTNGYAVDYYGRSEVGVALHRSKYEGGGDFPDFLLDRMLLLYEKKYRSMNFDLILYVPPTKSGNLVRRFVEKLSMRIGVPISHCLVKSRETYAQKIFQNNLNKRENVEGAFRIDKPEQIRQKTVLLVDDIYDSGATLKEIGLLLSSLGAKWVVPIVIAKTVGETL